MKTVILAGGLGTRLGEETSLRPKPMVEIGGLPILWHIMKIYSHAQFHELPSASERHCHRFCERRPHRIPAAADRALACFAD
jgi:NDP-sugar pyrophosphorylase family protein